MCVLLGRMGRKVAMIACVGDDEPGSQLLSQFNTSKVDTSQISIVKGTPSGTCIILLQETGENTILLSPAANNSWPNPYKIPE